MNRPKGGRGHKVAYESKVIRVPVPLLSEVDGMIERFYETGNVEAMATSEPINNVLSSKSEVIDIAKKLLKRKKSARVTIINLLQLIYGDESIGTSIE